MDAVKLDAMKISAQFAAYVWYTKRLTSGREAGIREVEATEFAKANWPKFLPLAHVGLGCLLRRIADAPAGAGKGPCLKGRSLPTKAHAPKLSRLHTLARAMVKRQRQR